jgi:hypothetical protein
MWSRGHCCTLGNSCTNLIPNHCYTAPSSNDLGSFLLSFCWMSYYCTIMGTLGFHFCATVGYNDSCMKQTHRRTWPAHKCSLLMLEHEEHLLTGKVSNVSINYCYHHQGLTSKGRVHYEVKWQQYTRCTIQNATQQQSCNTTEMKWESVPPLYNTLSHPMTLEPRSPL